MKKNISEYGMTRTTILVNSEEFKELKRMDINISELMRELLHGYFLSRTGSYGKDVAEAKRRCLEAKMTNEEAKLDFYIAIKNETERRKERYAQLVLDAEKE